MPQCLARVEARGWRIGRISRDYYDLWYLLKIRISREMSAQNLSENRLLRAASRLIRGENSSTLHRWGSPDEIGLISSGSSANSSPCGGSRGRNAMQDKGTLEAICRVANSEKEPGLSRYLKEESLPAIEDWGKEFQPRIEKSSAGVSSS